MLRNWPPGFRYSPVSIYRGVAANLFVHFLSSPDPAGLHIIDPFLESQTVHSNLEIRKIEDPSHLLIGQYGVFAALAIPAHLPIGEYVGEIFFNPGDASSSPYKGVHCWRVAFGSLVLHISSTEFANELAFINDFRDLGKAPNVRPAWILHRGVYHFCYETLREILPQEEVLVDYGKSWEKKWNLASLNAS
jgi:SET domain